MFWLTPLVILHLNDICAYDLKCPTEPHWRFRAKVICGIGNEKQYSCLFDENKKKYVESCSRKIDYVQAGQKYVIIGLPTNGKCNGDRYQPSKFWINSNSQCVYLKSLCNELGQIMVSFGSEREDVQCRCNHTQGYAFVMTPENPCCCVPEKEDCSCYKKLCGDNRILQSDYRCVPKNEPEEISKYNPLPSLPINKHGTLPPTKHPTTAIVVIDSNGKKELTYSIIASIFVILGLIISVTVVTAKKVAYADKTDLDLLLIEKEPCDDKLAISNHTTNEIVRQDANLQEHVLVVDSTNDLDISRSKEQEPMYKGIDQSCHDGITPLMEALEDEEDDDFKIAESLIQLGADIDATNGKGQTAAWFACNKGKREAVRFLVENQCDIDKPDERLWAPLKAAAGRGYWEICKYLISNNAGVDNADNEGWSPLMSACREGYIETVELFINNGAKIDHMNNEGQTALFLASSHGKLQVVKLLVEKGSSVNKADKENCTPLKAACGMGHIDVCDFLISKGGDVNKTDKKGESPLFSACSEGHFSIAKILTNHNAKVNSSNVEMKTPLWMACHSGSVEIVRLLVETGCDINGVDESDRTPFWAACSAGQKDVCAFLISRNVDIHKADNEEMTPFLVACKNGHKHILEFLMEYNVNINAMNNLGQNAFRLAVQNKREDIIRLLAVPSRCLNNIDAKQITLSID